MRNLNNISLKEWNQATLKISDARNNFSSIVNDIIENDTFRIINKDQDKGVLMFPLADAISLFEELEDLRLSQMAMERLGKVDRSTLLSHEDVKKELGL